MKLIHRVKVYSDNVVLEGVFVPYRSNEYNITVDTLNGIVWTVPWELVSRAAFFPEVLVEDKKVEDVSEQSLLFAGAS
jgi:hypothetical protein